LVKERVTNSPLTAGADGATVSTRSPAISVDPAASCDRLATVRSYSVVDFFNPAAASAFSIVRVTPDNGPDVVSRPADDRARWIVSLISPTSTGRAAYDFPDHGTGRNRRDKLSRVFKMGLSNKRTFKECDRQVLCAPPRCNERRLAHGST